MKRRSAPLYGPCGSGRTLRFFYFRTGPSKTLYSPPGHWAFCLFSLNFIWIASFYAVFKADGINISSSSTALLYANSIMRLFIIRTFSWKFWNIYFDDWSVLMFRYLDDVGLHHLIDALCKLSSEAMDVAYANKVFCLFATSSTLNYLCGVVDVMFIEWLVGALWSSSYSNLLVIMAIVEISRPQKCALDFSFDKMQLHAYILCFRNLHCLQFPSFWRQAWWTGFELTFCGALWLAIWLRYETSKWNKRIPAVLPVQDNAYSAVFMVCEVEFNSPTTLSLRQRNSKRPTVPLPLCRQKNYS